MGYLRCVTNSIAFKTDAFGGAQAGFGARARGTRHARGEIRSMASQILFYFVKETIEDKPIDQMPAEEVADEEIEENNENQEDAEEDADNRHPEEVPNEEIMEENSEAKERDNGLVCNSTLIC